jgi:hypothetical protein
MKFFATSLALSFAIFHSPLALDAEVNSHVKARESAVYAKSAIRNYNAVLTPEEQKEISYVVETVGNSSLYSIAKAKSSVKRSGKLVEHVHPLQFLAYIFSHEKLKACFHNARGRSWVWGHFFKGLKNSFEEEAARNNILPHMKDFTQRVGVNMNTFYALAKNGRWKEFIDTLLEEIQGSGNSGRYDM